MGWETGMRNVADLGVRVWRCSQESHEVFRHRCQTLQQRAADFGPYDVKEVPAVGRGGKAGCVQKVVDRLHRV